MNRAQLTDEMISLKNSLNVKSEQLARVKKTFRSIVIVITAVSSIMILSLYFVSMNSKQELTTLKGTIQEQNTNLQTLSKTFQKLKLDYKELSDSGSLVNVQKEDLLNDLMNNYKETSTRVKIQILETILSESEKYGMHPLILYSLFYVESSFRPWLEHEQAIITLDNGTKKKVRAVGLGGVIWEWWGDKLKENNIAETRGDLFDPITNIKATAFVYKEMYNMPMHKSANYKDESALLRYFGGNFISYVQRIDAKISTLVRPNLYRKD